MSNTEDKVVSLLMESNTVKSLGLKREIVVSLLRSYEKIVLRQLLENGHIELDNGLNIEVVPLLERVHVLRGVTYKNNRKYKLKTTMEDSLYESIENYYEKLRKEIE